MRRRHLVLATLALAGAAAVTMAHAATQAPYTQAAFAAAQQEGKPILLHVTAPWCPTCKAQTPIIDKLAAEPAHKDLVILKIDFDSQKDVLATLNVRSQSTLIAFHGKQERARSAGDTNEASIRALAQKTAG